MDWSSIAPWIGSLIAILGAIYAGDSARNSKIQATESQRQSKFSADTARAALKSLRFAEDAASAAMQQAKSATIQAEAALSQVEAANRSNDIALLGPRTKLYEQIEGTYQIYLGGKADKVLDAELATVFRNQVAFCELYFSEEIYNQLMATFEHLNQMLVDHFDLECMIEDQNSDEAKLQRRVIRQKYAELKRLLRVNVNALRQELKVVHKKAGL